MYFASECPGCGSIDITVHDRGFIQAFVSARTGMPMHAGRTAVCNSCTLVFCHARMNEWEALALYEDYRGPSYNAERDLYEPGYSAKYGHLNGRRDYLADVESFILEYSRPPVTVLDIGGNDGENTPFHDQAEITVCEIGDGIPDASFDVVVLSHVLEHVAEPRELLGRAVVRSSGLVYIEVPIEINNDHWHEHVQKFNARSLHEMSGHSFLAYQEIDTSIGRIGMAVMRGKYEPRVIHSVF